MQKIAAVARRSNDDAVVAGAFMCFHRSSNLFSFADNELILRMIQADREYSDCAAELFPQASWFGEKRHPRLLEVARAITEGRIEVSRKTGVAAARYVMLYGPSVEAPLAKDYFGQVPT